MADNSVSESSTLSGEGTQTPQFVTEAKLNAALNGVVKSLKAELAELKAAKAEVITQEASKADSGVKPAHDPEKIEMQKTLKLLLEKDAKREETLKAEQLQSAVKDALLANGIDSRHIKQAMAFVTQEKLVNYDDDGVLKVKIDHLDYDLADGIQSWARSEDAKLFIAPKGASGSGQKGGFQTVTQKPTADPKSAFHALLTQLPAAMKSAT